MGLKKVLFAICLGWIVGALAQENADDQCQKALLEAEKQRNPQVYTQCGFDNTNRALAQWSGWAEHNNAYQAMYELCMRYSDTSTGTKLCQMAALGGNGPALMYQADRLYAQKKYAEAFQSYSQALKSSLLTNEEKGQIAEKIGILYLDPNSSYYNAAKGWPLIEKATKQRGALANNIVGVYAMYGLEGQSVDMKKAFEHFWRSVLLGCPNAEENLGLFYLVYQKKITPENARQLMQNRIFTCQSDDLPEKKGFSGIIQRDCDCRQVMQKEQMASQYPYRLVSVTSTGAVLQDETGRRFSALQDTVLPNGGRVSEIHKTALIILEGKERHVVSLAPDENCVQYCQNQQNGQTQKKNTLPKVQSYRLTFTPSECSDILYYAERLVDTKLPFTGKEECGYSGELDEATRILMAQ